MPDLKRTEVTFVDGNLMLLELRVLYVSFLSFNTHQFYTDGIAQKQELHAAVFVSDPDITSHDGQSGRAPVSVDALESPLAELPRVESPLGITFKTLLATTSADGLAVTNTREPVRHLRVSATELTEDLTTSPSTRSSSRHLTTAEKGSGDDKPNTFWLVVAILFVPCILGIIVSVRYAWRDEYRDS